jgi:signal transduction histidine kinase
MRGPLTSIHGFTQMMARNLSTVQQQAAQLDRLISDLMSKPTLEHGQLGLDFQKVDLGRLVRAAAERFGVAEPERRLELRMQPVPQILADPTRLNQVLDNLLTNAAKYSPPEAPIELGLEERDEAAILWVADRGVGIAPEHLERLFDRFYRVPEAERQQAQGLGLGLAIVHDLVTAHGGRVWAESRGPGQGSTFYVRLPLPDAAPDRAGPGLKGARFLSEPEAESG